MYPAISNCSDHRVCELLLGGSSLEKESKSFLRMRSEMSSGSGNLGRTGTMDQGDREVTQSGQKLRSRAGMHTRAIFAKGDITHVMQGILDAPVSTIEIEKTLRTGLQGGQVSDEVHDFLGRLACFANGHRAGKTSHLTYHGAWLVVRSTIRTWLTARMPRRLL